MVVDMLSRDHVRRQTQRANPDFRPLPHSIGVIDDRPQVMRNTLFLNRGDGTYAEIAQLSGVEASEWSWGIVFLDVDLDGFEDVLVTTGNLHDVLDADAAARNQALIAATKSGTRPKTLLNFPRLETPSLAFRNRGDLTFEEVGKQWGFDAIGISHGMALADLDNDGDLDVIVNNLRAEAGIYRNDIIAPRVAVRLKGEAPNTQGIGARIRVTGGPIAQSQELISGGRYLSGDDPMRVFATGTLTNPLTIEVLWRSGKASRVSAVMPNRLYEIAEPSGAWEPESVKHEASVTRPDAPTLRRSDAPTLPRSHALTVFEDVSDLLNHNHHEDPFIRFGPQPQMPNRLTELGPGLAWVDVDGDGWDDLIVGCGRGGTLAVYRNNGRGGFEAMQAKALTMAAKDDFTGLVGWVPTAGKHSVLVGVSNYESASGESSTVLRYDYVGASLLGSARFRLPRPAIGSPQSSTVGALALADIDGDGDLDLFVGGRVIPGRYPEPASSRIFRNVGGRLETDADNSHRLAEIGLVSGAVFSDLDGDGDADLALACEWGPIRVFRNDAGQFTEVTAELGLDQYRGWWNGITTGDFDGDGRLDLVASNWGRNTKYQRYRAQPLGIYYGDFRDDGAVETIEAHFDPNLGKIVPWPDFASAAQAFPWIREAFGNYQAYSLASIEEILGNHFAKAKELQATWLESTVFLNRGGRFEAHVLPLEAQFAPAFGVSVADFDGDGNEDIFLAQNFFATQPETSRYDAGRGLWLRGDGQGGFTAVPGQESGVLVYGEQRGAAFSDYDADGRVDLVVTQNGAATKLYRNVTAKPGLRIRLVGPPANPSGVGAAIRLRFGDRWGPAREIHGGSGYWSQDSAIVVMACPEWPTVISVRWPGGKIIEAPVPQAARELGIDSSGRITNLK
jgi:enediyne biosynthesis protein E4